MDELVKQFIYIILRLLKNTLAKAISLRKESL